MSIGRRIELLLVEKGMSRKELSQKSGISEAAISRYINGSRQPKTVCLNAIADALNVPINDLLETKAFVSDDLDEAIKLIARNSSDITFEQKKEIINALLGV